MTTKRVLPCHPPTPKRVAVFLRTHKFWYLRATSRTHICACKSCRMQKVDRPNVLASWHWTIQPIHLHPPHFYPGEPLITGARINYKMCPLHSGHVLRRKKYAIKNVRVYALHFCTRVAQVRASRTSRAIAICFNYFLRPSIIVECVQATGSELSLYFMWSSKTITYAHIIMLWRINCARAHRAMHRSSGQSVEFGPIARW